MNAKHVLLKAFSTATIFSLGVLATSCINKNDIDRFIEDRWDSGLNISVIEPVERDFDAIRNDGTLRMITRYSSNTYFLNQGLEWGFEYELVREFAKEEDLALEVVIIGPDENPYDLLNSGAGDLIAANYTATPERKEVVNFTRPYNLVNQVVVYSEALEEPPETLEELSERGIPVTVRRNSSYYGRLRELQNEGFNLRINVISNDMDTESILSQVAEGRYMATVADDNMYQASSAYMKGLVQGPTIAENDTIAWAIRKNAPELEIRMNRYLYKHFRFAEQNREPRRSTLLNVLRKRYFEGGTHLADYYVPETQISTTGIISPFDDKIKEVADSAGVDWLMVAAMIAQETKFNPNSRSWMGAVGLMQVLPQYSQVRDVEMLFDIDVNLKEGIRIINEHLKHYAYMDSTNRWAFALATYNAGPGHIADARRLAIDRNRNPNEWENVADALLKLMQRKYYKDAKYGFCRGIETVRYVKEIMNRHKTYRSILALTERNWELTGPGVIGIFN